MTIVEEILELVPEWVLEASPKGDGGFDTVEQRPRDRLGELLADVEEDLTDEPFVDREVSSGKAGKFSWWRDYGADWPPRYTDNLCTTVATVAYSVGSDAAQDYL